MANGEQLSVDMIQKLSKALSDANELLEKQKQLITTIMQGETEIANVRMSKLEQYFEKYSSKLNSLAKQYKDDITEVFSVLDKKLSASYKKLNSLSGTSKGSDKTTDETKTEGSSNETSSASTSTRELLDEIRGIRELLNNGVNINDKEQQEILSNILKSLTSKDAYTPNNNQESSGNADTINIYASIEALLNNLRGFTNFEAGVGGGQTESDDTKGVETGNVGISQEIENAKTLLAELKNQSEIAVSYEDLQLASLNEAIAAQQELNKLRAEAAFSVSDDAIKLEAEKAAINDSIAFEKKEAEKLAKWKAREELKSRLANGGVLTADEIKRINKAAAERKKVDEANYKEEQKREQKKEKEKNRLESRSELKSLLTTPLGPGDSLSDRFNALKDHTMDKVTPDDDGKISGAAKAVAGLDTAAAAISDLAKQLEGTVDKIAGYKGDIDTRLAGSKNDTRMGSYWDQLIVDMTSVGAVTPFFKQEDFANNIKSLVDQGIAFDLKQRAFLMTIKDKIATTFEVADGTLLRLIRLQQEDSTAGRMGMEVALNSFLNNMYENTEYLKTVASGVRQSLQEMEALMSGAAATEVEYQVQKWMGSLYSVGMSQEAVNAIATALGQIAAGQIDGLTSGSGAGNLLVMAANESGKSIAEILTSGLNADETNDLLQATVNYLADIAESTKGNNVVQQQLASVFGVKASDLKAATNLAVSKKESKSSIGDIYAKQLTYDDMLNELFGMAGSMLKRTSMAEMMQNVWANGQYTLAGSMANNPISYITYKVASLLDSVAGGIAIPAFSVMGNMVDLETTVADLMRVASMSGGVLSSLSAMIGGLGRSFSGKAMLRKLGIEEGEGLQINTRGGKGLTAAPSDEPELSESGYIGNADGNAIKETTMADAENSKKKQMIKAKEEEPANQVDVINTSVLKIYEILDDVAKGTKTLRVRVDNYGLTGNTKSTKAQGGVGGLVNDDTGFSTDTSLSDNGISSNLGGSSSSRASGNSVTSLGGWTVV